MKMLAARGNALGIKRGVAMVMVARRAMTVDKESRRKLWWWCRRYAATCIDNTVTALIRLIASMTSLTISMLFNASPCCA
jgi:hypothetical protein